MRKFLLTLGIAGALLAQNGFPQAAPSGWSIIPSPKEQIGLYIQPQLLVVRDRLHLIFAGTNPKAINPEIMQCYRTDTSEGWSDVRAPFFGLDQARVRNLAVCATRYAIGMLYQRQLTQGERAFEIDFTLSADNGFEWIQPVLVDSFVCESRDGTSISVAGRERSNKVEFAAAWGTEGNGVKAALINLRDPVRAPAKSIGYHSALSPKVMIGGHTNGGFGVVWSDSKGLRSVRLKPISGEADESVTLITKDVQNNFALGYRPRGPLELITILGSESFLFGWEGEWKREEPPAEPPGASGPVPGPNPVCTVDEDDKLHVLYEPTGGSDVYYTTNKTGSWSQPEKVFTMKNPNAPYSIACTDKYVWACYGYGTFLVTARRPR